MRLLVEHPFVDANLRKEQGTALFCAVKKGRFIYIYLVRCGCGSC